MKQNQEGAIKFVARKGKGVRVFKERRQPALNPEETRRKKLKYDSLVFPWDIPGKRLEDNPKLEDVFLNTDMTDPEVQKKVPGFKWPPTNPEDLPVGTKSTKPKRPPPPTYAAIFGPYMNKVRERDLNLPDAICIRDHTTISFISSNFVDNGLSNNSKTR